MGSSRRDVLKAGLAGAAVAASGGSVCAQDTARSRDVDRLRLLILGGTGFIGPHMVREALRRGHTITLFNRGRSNAELFPDLETIIGDRGGDLDGLVGREWDAVIDNSGYMPQHVRRSAEVLTNSVGHYVFISSISAYASFAEPNDESSALAAVDPVPETFSWQHYGALKALAERWAADELGSERLTVLRPTYICGPGDHTDRFTYWPVRTRRGGDMLWPGSSSHTLQIIDVRDLAQFVVDCVEQRTAGTYNTVTPVGSYTFGNLLEDAAVISVADVRPVWASDAFLQAHDAASLLPIYHPASGDAAHVSSVSGARARAAGLRTRPVRETIRDLLAWWDTLPAARRDSARFPLTMAREAELLAALREHASQ